MKTTVKRTVVISKKSTNGNLYKRFVCRERRLVDTIDGIKVVEDDNICKVHRVGNGPRVW